MASYFVKDLGKVITGNTPSKNTAEFYDTEDIRFVKPDIISDSQITNIEFTNEHISEQARSKARIVGSGAVFVTCIGSIGKIGIAGEGEYAFNQQINAIEPNEKIFSRYLAYCLFYNRKHLADISNAPVVPIINKTQFENFSINITENILEQKGITNRLDSVSNLILLIKQQLNELDNLIKSRFIEMFGDIHNSKRFPYVTIESFTTVMSGGTPDRGTPEYWTAGNIRWVKTTELQNCVITDTEEKITELGMVNSSAKMIPATSVLIAMYGQGKTRGMTGYLAVDCTTNQACACILPSKIVNQKYLWQYMILSYDKLRDMAKGGNQPNLSSGMIKKFPILMPPLELQGQFAAFVEQVDKLKAIAQKVLNEMQLLFDSLLQEYFG